jgi:TPR repeat protein
MSQIIELADYRDVTPKEAGINLPEDAFMELGLSLCGAGAGDDELVQAHKWLSLAAMRGHAKARVHRLRLSHRMSAECLVQAQREVQAFSMERAGVTA